MTYTTIGRSRGASPNARSWGCYSVGVPTSWRRQRLWDVDFQTAVAQAELRSRAPGRDAPRALLPADAGDGANGAQALIETTRPELIRRASRCWPTPMTSASAGWSVRCADALFARACRC